ncbi:hypothetical protein D9613_009541 [Agrocybe pediades]|uniref:DUF6534 domain-containing protein n=1 Tax=Agrocybe pediades TaxID=84607 RepID=A0A8H4R5C8_9AGAR|nr:hypothetical protein D9613_009541 [Agrocybe pediades]
MVLPPVLSAGKTALLGSLSNKANITPMAWAASSTYVQNITFTRKADSISLEPAVILHLSTKLYMDDGSIKPLFVIDFNLSQLGDGIFVGALPSMPNCNPRSETNDHVDHTGFIFSTILVGVILRQAWNYAQRNNDGWKMRSLVSLLVILDIATTSNNVLLVHIYVIQHFGNLFELTVINVGFLIELALTVTVVFVRSYKLSGVIAVVATLGFASSLLTVAEQVKHARLFELTLAPIRVSAIFGHALVTVADGITTKVLFANFMKARSESGVKQTVSILERLLVIVVARGSLVTVANGLIIVLYIIYPMQLYWLAVQFFQSKLYIVTLLSMLNDRASCNLPATVLVSDNSRPSVVSESDAERLRSSMDLESARDGSCRNLSAITFARRSQASDWFGVEGS